MKKIFYLVFASSIVMSCQTYNEEDLAQFDQEIETFVASKSENFTKSESGLYYKIIEEGAREDYIRMTDEVTFAYKGTFLSGEVFQIITAEDAITFQVRELIAGWQEALMLLKENGKIHVIIPPYLGYGDKQTGLIPPNSILYYELEVLSVI